MNLKKYRKVLSYCVIFILLIGNIISASLPEIVNIITEKGIINKVQYENFDLNVEKIKIEGSNDVVYCLEIDKKFPSGQDFSMKSAATEEINNIIAAGYPNRTVEELNLNDENEAYSATQIAIWSYVEGYDINKLMSSNPKMLNAISNIYNDGLSGKYKNEIQTKIYKTSDESVQEVIVISNYDLNAEQKAESKQIEYVPQEG